MILPFSLTLGHLVYTWITLELDQGKKKKVEEGKGKLRSSKEDEDQAATLGLLTGI